MDIDMPNLHANHFSYRSRHFILNLLAGFEQIAAAFHNQIEIDINSIVFNINIYPITVAALKNAFNGMWTRGHPAYTLD